jgi:hypothetical protein
MARRGKPDGGLTVSDTTDDIKPILSKQVRQCPSAAVIAVNNQDSRADRPKVGVAATAKSSATAGAGRTKIVGTMSIGLG